MVGVKKLYKNVYSFSTKQEELVIRLDKKLVVLREEQEAVQEESELNESLGGRVASKLESVARTAEVSKYRLHVEEVGKITSLLLSLSGRLARAENALYGMPADHPERVSIILFFILFFCCFHSFFEWRVKLSFDHELSNKNLLLLNAFFILSRRRKLSRGRGTNSSISWKRQNS